MKDKFLEWAFLDIEHTGRIKDTYFGQNAREAAIKNLQMAKSLAAFLCIISVAVIAMALTFFGQPMLAAIYLIILGIEVVIYVVSSIALTRTNIVPISYILASFFLLHMFGFSILLGTYYSRNESAVVYMVILAISQILFVMPPVVTTTLSGISIVFLLVASYIYKNDFFFKADIINGLGVYILSVLLGGYFTRIRIQASMAQRKTEQLNRELERMSMTDQLTGLYNHRSFVDIYDIAASEAEKLGERIGIIMMDIDKFKNYNDSYGHVEGDACLRQIGTCLAGFKADGVIPFRFGGEEFIVIVREKECDRIGELAEGCRSAVEQLGIPHEVLGKDSCVTISVGYYVDKVSGKDNYVDIVKNADTAMYDSKKNGGNTVSRR